MRAAERPEQAGARSMLPGALARLDALASWFGGERRLPGAEELMALACDRAGSRDFGDAEVAAPLRRLLSACAEEADLSLVGRRAVRWDAVRLLSNTLRLRAEEKRRPGILGTPVSRPIFITGLPRSGTTFLHRLLLRDPANCAPRVWQTICPYPPRGSARAMRRVRRQLRGFDCLAPDFRGLHPLEADSPQECSEITAHVFRSLRFDTTYRVPSYRRWLDETGHLAAYRFERRFLQHLEAQGICGRWVLKCPDHVFALAELRAVFPDAQLVFVHRDPLQVLASLSRLTQVLRGAFARRVDLHEIGQVESDRWFEGAERMIRACADLQLSWPIFHVRYLDLVAEPLRTIRHLYQHFGLDLSASATRRIADAVAGQPNGGYGPRSHRLADYGLDAEAEREKFAGYVRFFDVRCRRA